MVSLLCVSPVWPATCSYSVMRNRVAQLQVFCRGALARHDYRNLLKSIEKIQSVFRMVLASQRVKLSKQEAEAERLREEAIAQGLAAEEAERQKQEKLAQLASEEERRKREAAEKR